MFRKRMYKKYTIILFIGNIFFFFDELKRAVLCGIINRKFKVTASCAVSIE